MAWPYRTEIITAAAAEPLVMAGDLLREVGGDGANVEDAALAAASLAGAVGWVEGETGSALGRRTYRSHYWRPGAGGLMLGVTGGVAAGSLAVRQDGVTEGGVVLTAGWMVYRSGFAAWTGDEVEADYQSGYGAGGLPADLRQAVLGLAGVFYTRRERPAGVVTADVGGVSRLVYGNDGIPGWVVDLVEPYRRATV